MDSPVRPVSIRTQCVRQKTEEVQKGTLEQILGPGHGVVCIARCTLRAVSFVFSKDIETRTQPSFVAPSVWHREHT